MLAAREFDFIVVLQIIGGKCHILKIRIPVLRSVSGLGLEIDLYLLAVNA